MFLTMPTFGDGMDFHLGTSYDYFRQSDISPKIIFMYLTVGLLNLIDEIEKGKIKPETRLYGNTFYLKKSTLERFGFHSRKLNFAETLPFGMNYLELTLLKSITTRKITLVPLNNILIVFTTAGELLANRKIYLDFYEKIAFAGVTENIPSVRNESIDQVTL